MDSVVTSEELKKILEGIRETVQAIDFSTMQNVVFLNTNALYFYMASQKVGTFPERTILSLLDKISAYIPLGLTEDTLDIFLQAANTQDYEQVEFYRQAFEAHARMDFLSLVREARSKAQWQRILAACEKLRKQQESSYCLSYENSL